jgi:hypothetical protein
MTVIGNKYTWGIHHCPYFCVYVKYCRNICIITFFQLVAAVVMEAVAAVVMEAVAAVVMEVAAAAVMEVAAAVVMAGIEL